MKQLLLVARKQASRECQAGGPPDNIRGRGRAVESGCLDAETLLGDSQRRTAFAFDWRFSSDVSDERKRRSESDRCTDATSTSFFSLLSV